MTQMIAVKTADMKRSQWLTMDGGGAGMTTSRLCAAKYPDGSVGASCLESLGQMYPDYTFTLHTIQED